MAVIPFANFTDINIFAKNIIIFVISLKCLFTEFEYLNGLLYIDYNQLESDDENHHTRCPENPCGETFL